MSARSAPPYPVSSGTSRAAEQVGEEAARAEQPEQAEGGDVARDHERQRRRDAPGAAAGQVGAGRRATRAARRRRPRRRRRPTQSSTVLSDEAPGRPSPSTSSGPAAAVDDADQQVGERQQERRRDGGRDQQDAGAAVGRRARARCASGALTRGSTDWLMRTPVLTRGHAHARTRCRAAARSSSRARGRSSRGRRPGPAGRRAAAGPPSRRSRRRAGTRPPRPRRRRSAAARPRAGTRRSARRPRAWSLRREDAGAGDADERPGVAGLEEVVRDRRVRLLLLDEVEVVVVDEPDLDLAGGDRLDDGGVLLVRLRLVRLQALEPRRGCARRPP